MNGYFKVGMIYCLCHRVTCALGECGYRVLLLLFSRVVIPTFPHIFLLKLTFFLTNMNERIQSLLLFHYLFRFCRHESSVFTHLPSVHSLLVFCQYMKLRNLCRLQFLSLFLSQRVVYTLLLCFLSFFLDARKHPRSAIVVGQTKNAYYTLTSPST